MVFKPFTTLARQSISKHLVNGYAQSVVAATQSSYASSSVSFARVGQQNSPAKLQSAFGGANSGRTAPGKDGHGSDGLSSYYAVQSQDDKEEKDAKKYLFSRKILWSKAQHQQQQKQLLEISKDDVASIEEPPPKSGPSVKSEEALEIEDVAKKPVDAAVVWEAIVFAEASPTATVSDTEATVVEEQTPSPTLSNSSTLVPVSETPAITSQYNRELERLRDQGRHHELKAIFDHMVKEGIPLSTTTFNHLLIAMTKIHPERVFEVVNVYQTMLRQKVSPSTATYSILIDFLADRAIVTRRSGDSARAKAERFGYITPYTRHQMQEMQNEEPMQLALDVFYASTDVRKERTFHQSVYSILVNACAIHGREEDMLNVYTHMEQHGILPTVETMLALIDGFGRVGNINSAVETYNSYQALDAARDPTVADQRYRVYKALIGAYMAVGDPAGALSFLEKIMEASKDQARSVWLVEAVINGFLDSKKIDSAVEWIARQNLQNHGFGWLSRTVVQAADMGEYQVAEHLYTALMAQPRVTAALDDTARAQSALLALCSKEGRVERAREIWDALISQEFTSGPSIGSAVIYTAMLFETGRTVEALVVLNQFSEFYMSRSIPTDVKSGHLRTTFEHVISSLSLKGLLTPIIAADICGFSVYHCGSIGMEASRIVLNMFDAQELQGLEWPQLDLLLRVQSAVLQETEVKGIELLHEDVQRFEQISTTAMDANLPIRDSLRMVVDRAVGIVGGLKPELAGRWNAYHQSQMAWRAPTAPVAYVHSMEEVATAPMTVPTSEVGAIVEDKYDPYWVDTDVRVSHAIDTSLERTKKIFDAQRLYRNARKAGKLIRMPTLARMIGAAARAKQPNLIEEIYRNARVDTPLVMEFRSVRYGWSGLLDAMIAAHLTLGNREQASLYHEEILKMGASPSANTYGLYIVSLKASGHVYYDEASEAVKIFERAKAENVLPSSFLYNALIGKLAKARRVDDSLFYFAEMRAMNIKPTSVTYGTMINALTRVGDEHFAEELFQEMEAMPNYKPRPAPYNSLMQFFINTKRNRSKVLAYFNRMCSLGIEATSHTYKLLIEAYATLDPPDMLAAEGVLEMIRAKNGTIESAHHAALIHAKGCVLQDADAAISHFEAVINSSSVSPDNTLYQALFESLVANHRVHETSRWIADMESRKVKMTPYIANTLIHGWTLEKDILRAKAVYDSLSADENHHLKREPSTYEAMTRAFLAVEDREGAMEVVAEMHSRGYPNAVMVRVLDLVRGRSAEA